MSQPELLDRFLFRIKHVSLFGRDIFWQSLYDNTGGDESEGKVTLGEKELTNLTVLICTLGHHLAIWDALGDYAQTGTHLHLPLLLILANTVMWLPGGGAKTHLMEIIHT